MFFCKGQEPTMANGGTGNKIAVIGILVLLTAGILLRLQCLAYKKKTDFIEAMRANEVGGMPIDLRDKVWTDDELANARVFKLDDSYGPQRSIERTLHTRGQYTLSATAYAYQATVTNDDTGVKHIFGYTRRQPARWRWVTVHPDSAIERAQQRMQDQLPERRMRPARQDHR